MSDKLLIYIDPGFIDYGGHYRNFALNIHGEALKRDVDIWHYVNNNVSPGIADNLNLRKVFSTNAYLSSRFLYVFFNKDNSRLRMHAALLIGKFLILKKHLSERRYRLRTIRDDIIQFDLEYRTILSFIKGMESILNDLCSRPYENVALYMYTSHPVYLALTAELLHSSKYRNLNVDLFMHIFYLDNEFCAGNEAYEYTKLLRLASLELEEKDSAQRIRICADSERTIARYAPFFYREIKLFPVPLLSDVPSSDYERQAGMDGQISIGFLGYAHLRQGYHLVELLYRTLTRQYPNVHFIVRQNLHFIEADIANTVDEFTKASENILHIHQDMTKEEYVRCVCSCDIILIPHARDEYPCQTSGTFIDALTMRKIVVVPAATWMADQLKYYGSGEAFESDNFTSFLKAVCKILDNLKVYALRSDRNIEGFASLHSAKRLFDQMDL